MAYKVLDIANKLLKNASDTNGGELMSNLKLQKMLYYEQGYHLAVFGTPLFDEDIEAWMYGPVVPSVYEHFHENGAGGIVPETDNPIKLSDEEEDLFNNVFQAYIEFSAYGLMRKTHEESPWKDNESYGRGSIITLDSMKKYFLTQISK